MSGIHSRQLVIACGALGREIKDIIGRYNWSHLELMCLDARLHNRPDKIPRKLRKKIEHVRTSFDKIFIAYADCGTGGGIDEVIDAYGLERLPGPHCYSCFAGEANFIALQQEEPGTFYLTDFLAKHFDRLVAEPLRIHESSTIKKAVFGNYRRLVYLSQSDDEVLLRKARLAASQLNLSFVHKQCGYGLVESKLRQFAVS